MIKLIESTSGPPPRLPPSEKGGHKDDNQKPDHAHFALLSLLAYKEKKASIHFKGNESFQSFDAPGDLKAFAVKIGDDAFIAFRGTVGWANWKIDLNAVVAGSPWRHRGFQLAWDCLKPGIDKWLKEHGPSTISLTGHSLGSAIAMVAAYDFAQSWVVGERNSALSKEPENEIKPRWPIGYVVGFGSPRVGLASFVQKYRSLGAGPDPSVTLADRTTRFVMATDIVARLPPPIFYKHVVSKTELGYQRATLFDTSNPNTLSKAPWYVRIFSTGYLSRGTGADELNIGLIHSIWDPTIWLSLKLLLFTSVAGVAFAQDISYHACRRYRDAFKPPNVRAAGWMGRKTYVDSLFIAYIQQRAKRLKLVQLIASNPLPDLLSVRDAKTILVHLGLYNGPLDDVVDDAYGKAIRDFQRSRGLVVDGFIGPRTLGYMRDARPIHFAPPTLGQRHNPPQ